MLAKLSRPAYGSAAELLAGLDYQLSAEAVLAGAAPGAVFVDDPTRPSAAFVHSAEGNFIGGDPTSSRFATGLRELLAATYVPERDGDLVLNIDHDDWSPVLEAVAPELSLFAVERRYYLFSGGQPRQRPNLPPDCRIVPIDAAFLERDQVPDHVREWVDGNWGGVVGFLGGGFGAAALHGDAVVSWSLADCVVADRAEIGIHTAPEYRRRGLAAQVTAAAVAIALGRGLTSVGWHCDEDNPGSYRTAESVGFTLRRRYSYLAGRPRSLAEPIEAR